MVFNHTGESDRHGATISLRGLDNAVYYRHTNDLPASLINDTGCGNTLAAERAPVTRLVLDSLRRFALEGGIDGFRFDLAPTMARTAKGFTPDAPVLAAIAQDPVLRNRIMIAEPWDIGPGCYQLGKFPQRWYEWNDRYRDGVRSFWRGGKHGGEVHAAGEFATRISGSADIFERPGRGPGASINFIAAHDGFSLRDCVTYEQRHNLANGEENRDGHGENHSWNCGVEGETDDQSIKAARNRDMRALIACLFLSRGTPMIAAGDEFGRTQKGNNNAYAQDNETTWLDWGAADQSLQAFTAAMADLRAYYLASGFEHFLTGKPQEWQGRADVPDVQWSRPDGEALSADGWQLADQLCMTLALESGAPAVRMHIVFNRVDRHIAVALPSAASGSVWRQVLESASSLVAPAGQGRFIMADVPGRCVAAFAEMMDV